MDGRGGITASLNVLANDYPGLVEADEPLATKRQAIHLGESNGSADELIVCLRKHDAFAEMPSVLP